MLDFKRLFTASKKFANAEDRSNPPLSMLLLQPHAGVSMSESK
jgi:hypothetical protein